MTTRHHIDRYASAVIEDGVGDNDDMLTTPQTAAWLRMSVGWLEIGRSKGWGPPFVKLAPQVVRYRRGDVKRWLAERQHTRTSEYQR
jgi:predicted DNA-binding transcriptional regulator AlpA